MADGKSQTILEVGELKIPDFNDDFDIFVDSEKIYSNETEELIDQRFAQLPEK